jgi:ABC-type uncharacterized transport system substrate-binding protein
MKRRKFIALLGGAAAMWPLAARAQTGKLVRLGYLEGGARADPTTQNLRRQFVLGMRNLGYNEGRDYLLEERYAAGQLDSFPGYAHELVELPVDMIVAGGEAAIRAAKRATSRIPIVMTLAADPIGSGLVPNLARPGGNLTGMSALASDLAGKRVELLKELVPKVVSNGGLMSYGVDTVEVFRRSALYIDRILKGEKPTALPVQQPTQFELVVNLKTAKALGLDLPATVLARADEVIE